MLQLSWLRQSFRHGVHPPHHKAQTVDLPIQRVPFVDLYRLPLDQHIGIPAIPVVVPGQEVRRGQLIAEPGGFVSTALHSPVTGTVRSIGLTRGFDGSFRQAIEIQADPYSTQQLDLEPPPEGAALSREAFIAAIQQAGIVGLGGAAFPSHVKYVVPEGQSIDEVLVNGAECEPFLTNDHRLMVERPEALLRGTELLRQQLGARRATIGVESNKPDAIETLRRHLQPAWPIEVVGLEVKYPQGAEKMLIRSVYGREVPAGQLPRDLGIAVNNVGTLVALADYFALGMPLIERVLTVSGPGVTYPANLIVPLGTPIREVLRFCGGLKDSTREVIMGGPMMGFPVASLDAPVLKGTSGILAFTAEAARLGEESPCIRCGRCLEACPYFLNPSRFARLSKARLYAEMRPLQVMDCVECGACTYACPSNIPIVQLIRAAKDHLRRHKTS